MTDLVPTEDIERLVGTTRRQREHYARAVSGEQTVYILHSHECKDSGIDIRDCPYSVALDRGIWSDSWADYVDIPIRVAISDGLLVPEVE